MKVFWTEKHALHMPKWYVADGAVRECQEVAGRVEGILRALRGMEVGKLMEGDVMRAIGRVHDAGYLEYLKRVHAEWFSEFKCDVLPDTFPRVRAHGPAPSQTAGFDGGGMPLKLAARAGWYCFDMAAPITAGTWEAAVAAARVAVSAAEAVMGGARAAYGLCRPPGHHAGRDYCGGFCYLNNAAIAAECLLAEGTTEDTGKMPVPRRVAILDVDYHHGNGTQDIFYQRDDVLFVSIHADPNTQYPYFWGHAQERGSGKGEGFNWNLPLPRGATSAAWFAALESGLKRIEEFAPAALVVSLGVDAHETDGVGDFKLVTEDLAEAGTKIAGLHLPTVFVQEGGYNLATIGACVAAVLGGFEGI
jgi:acetoin utilization deacetylase AcuC-like enzyme